MNSTDRRRLQQARATLRALTAKFPKDDVYGALMSLHDNVRTDDAIDQRLVLAGTAFLEHALELAISRRFRSDFNSDGKERTRLFATTESGPGLLSSFFSKIELARALGFLSELAAEDFRTLQAIRNHFAHTKLVSSLSDPEIQMLVALIHKNIGTDTGSIALQTIFSGNRLLLAYVIFHYYWLLDTCWPDDMVKHAP
jgi:hypothetical protein